jgi:hypothetical protein
MGNFWRHDMASIKIETVILEALLLLLSPSPKSPKRTELMDKIEKELKVKSIKEAR